MAEGSATQPSRLIRTICLPVSEEQYRQLVNEPARFRGFLDACWADMPELFPEGFEAGYEMKDNRWSRKMQLRLRRIELRNGVAYTIRPSFVMPYLTGKVEDVEDALFLRRFGVPHWALAQVFGRDPMYWYRQEVGLGRLSVVGTTVRRAELPRQLLADEHHERCQGEKVYVATTVAAGCCLGAEVADALGHLAHHDRRHVGPGGGHGFHDVADHVLLGAALGVAHHEEAVDVADTDVRPDRLGGELLDQR